MRHKYMILSRLVVFLFSVLDVLKHPYYCSENVCTDYNLREQIIMIDEPGDQKSDFPAGLARPALRALAGAGYTRLEQVSRASEAEVKRLHGMGPKALEQLRRALAAQGLSFSDGNT